MKTNVICKAQDMGKSFGQVESAIIQITENLPEFKSLIKADMWYEDEAVILANTLISTLPGGTLDRLTAKLLIHKASLLRVSTGGEE